MRLRDNGLMALPPIISPQTNPLLIIPHLS